MVFFFDVMMMPVVSQKRFAANTDERPIVGNFYVLPRQILRIMFGICVEYINNRFFELACICIYNLIFHGYLR